MSTFDRCFRSIPANVATLNSQLTMALSCCHFESAYSPPTHCCAMAAQAMISEEKQWSTQSRKGTACSDFRIVTAERRNDGAYKPALTSCGPYTTARTHVLPCSIYADPSAPSHVPICVRSCLSSPGRRPSIRSPSGLRSSWRACQYGWWWTGGECLWIGADWAV